MAKINDIRDDHFTKGLNVTELSEKHQISRKTIRKYLNQVDFQNKTPKPKIKKRSKLDPYKETILDWLQEDKNQRRKQRHTAKRIFSRLKEETQGFKCSYRLVADFVKQEKRKLYQQQDSFVPLEHPGGEAQIDFGEADFIENGTRYNGHYLNVSFTKSNAGFLQLFKGENFDCLVEGLNAIFQEINGIPTVLWFDNMSTAVKKILRGGGRELTESFLKFKLHNNFQARFCNPAKGNEKGNVENKVGYLRRNLLVPVPNFKDLKEFNKELLQKCWQDLERPHYKKEESIKKLFEEEQKQLLELPKELFAPYTYKTVKVNSYGQISLNKGRHNYSTAPKLANQQATVRTSAFSVTIFDKEMKEIVTHDRLYGKQKQSSMNWMLYLKQLSRKPGALKHSGIYKLMPQKMQEWLGEAEKQEQGKALKLLSQWVEETGIEKTEEAFETLLNNNLYDVDSLHTLLNQMNQPEIKIPELDLGDNLPAVPLNTDNPADYDRFIHEYKKMGGVN